MNRSRGVVVFDNGKSFAATRLSRPSPQRDFVSSPLPPAFERRTLTFAGDCRATLCAMLGPPKLQFQVFDVRQSTAGPTIAIDGDRATLVVGPNAISCESTRVSNVAHESVHLHLTDGDFGDASGLEQGFALHFELSLVEQHYGTSERQRHISHLPDSYSAALRDYEYLLIIADDPVMRILEKHGKLTGLSWSDLRRLFPRAGWGLSYQMVRRRRMRKG